MEFTIRQRFIAVLLAVGLHVLILLSINPGQGQLLTGLEGFRVSVIPMPSFVPEDSTLNEELPIEEIEAIEMIEEIEEVEIVETEAIEQVDAVEVFEIKPEPIPVEVPTVQVKQKKKVKKNTVAKKAVKQQTNIDSREKTDSFHDKKPTMTKGIVSDTGTSKKVEVSYKAIISAILQKYKEYPPEALKRKQEGTVMVVFTIKNNGNLANYEITESSGFKLLDKAVEKMLERAAPLPPFPDDIKRQSMTLLLPVDFYIKNLN